MKCMRFEFAGEYGGRPVAVQLQAPRWHFLCARVFGKKFGNGCYAWRGRLYVMKEPWQ